MKKFSVLFLEKMKEYNEKHNVKTSYSYDIERKKKSTKKEKEKDN